MRKVAFLILAVAACVGAYAGGFEFDTTSDHEDAAYNVCQSKKKSIFDSVGRGHDASKGKKWIFAQDKAAD